MGGRKGNKFLLEEMLHCIEVIFIKVGNNSRI